MDNLSEIVKEVVFSYATEGANLKTFPMSSERENAYSVLVVDTPLRNHPAGVVVMARIVDGIVVVEEDTTNRPLIDALIERGIPRENIIRAYAGEQLPELQETP